MSNYVEIYVDNMIIKRQRTKQEKTTTKKPTKKLVEQVNRSIKVTGYKINAQKSIVFLYTNNELSKKEIRKMILLMIASKS